MSRWIQSHKSTILLTLGYLTLGVILLTVFLYLTFPWQRLSDFILAKAEQLTVSEISVQESKVRFPLQVIWTGVVLSPHHGPPMRVVADRIILKWALRPLLSRRLELLWSIQMAGGEGQGQMAVQPTDQGLQYHFSGDVSKLQLGEIIEFINPNPYGIDGTVKIAEAQFDFLGKNFLKGSGSAVLEIADAKIGSLDLAFTQITGHLFMKAGVAHLENVMAQGPAMELTGSGNILFRSGLAESLINFSSRASLKKPEGPLALLNPFSVGSASDTGPEHSMELALRGTFKRPTLFLNGAAVFTFPLS